MRVNMDSSIATGTRFKKLRKRLGVSRNEVAGACFYVWLEAYERRLDTLELEDIDIAADIDGFAEALIGVGLATRIGDDRAQIHGVAERIKFLAKQAANGAKGGKKSGESRRKKREANASQKRSKRFESGEAPREAYSPDLTPDQDLALDLDPALLPARVKRADVAGIFADVLKVPSAVHVLEEIAGTRSTGIDGGLLWRTAQALGSLQASDAAALEFGCTTALTRDGFDFGGDPSRVLAYVRKVAGNHRPNTKPNGAARGGARRDPNNLSAGDLFDLAKHQEERGQ